MDDVVATQRSRPLGLYRDRFPGQPLLDTAVSHAMLRRVAAGSAGESLRLYAPDRALLFSSLDARRPGYARALSLADAADCPALIRLAGGHAALFLEESIAFAWASPDPSARLHIRQRFEVVAEWIKTSLQRLGLDARVGPVPGEYCPGQYSLNIGGRVKVMGMGQRVIQGGAHLGGVLTVGQTDVLRETLVPIYEALEVDFEPETAGGIADFDPSLGLEEIFVALIEGLRECGYEPDPRRFDASIRSEAAELIPLHRPQTREARNVFLRANRRDSKALVQKGLSDSPPDSNGAR